MIINTQQTVNLSQPAPCSNEVSLQYGENLLACCDETNGGSPLDNLIQEFFYSTVYVRINEVYPTAGSSRDLNYWQTQIQNAGTLASYSPNGFTGVPIPGVAGGTYWNFFDGSPQNSYSYQFGFIETGTNRFIYLVRSILYEPFYVLPMNGIGVDGNPGAVFGPAVQVIVSGLSIQIEAPPTAILYTLASNANNYTKSPLFSCLTVLDPNGLPNTLNTTGIRLVDGNSNGVDFRQGDLVMIMKNYPNEIKYELLIGLRNTGDLFISTTNTNDADKYFIDDHGDLRYLGCD